MMKSHSNEEVTPYSEVFRSKEFKDYVKSIPYDKSCKFILSDNLIIYIKKKVSLSYIDILGKTRNDISLDLVVEDKSNNTSILMENIDFDD